MVRWGGGGGVAHGGGGVAHACAGRVEALEATAMWGGQLEVRALSCALGVPIDVYTADAPCLRMGCESACDEGHAAAAAWAAARPIRISFHRKYFTLGEHYNAVVAVAPAAPLRRRSCGE